MQEHPLALNSFGMPKVLDGTDAMYTKIVQLMLLEKGTYQSHPNLGLGLRSRYRHNNSENFLQTLQMDITDQIDRFLPSLTTIEISVTMQNNILGIVIDTQNGAYAIAYNGSTDAVEAPAPYVLDNL